MPKSDLALLPADYSPVAERVALFYERFPEGRIVTRLISRTGRETIFRAAIYRTADELEPAATGWAAEREGDGEINTTACLENTETSAIGRALANLGFAAVPLRARPGAGPTRQHTSPTPRDVSSAHRDPGASTTTASRAAQAPAGRARRPAASRDARPALDVQAASTREARKTETSPSADLQARADAAGDLLALIRSAERSGLSGKRAELLRRRAMTPDVTTELHARLARLLRRWIARRVARNVGPGQPNPGPQS